MRKTIFGLVAAVCLLFVGTAHADEIYNLNLTITKHTGNVTPGTGSFEINTLPPTTINSQEYFYQGAGLESLIFSIGGDTFDLSDSAGAYTRFTSGALDSIQFVGVTSTSQAIITISANGLGYTFSDSAKGETASGKIVVQAPIFSQVTSTPEPSSFILLGTALLSGAGVLRRRLA